MIIEKSRNGVQSTAVIIIKIGKYIGLTINKGKTKYMMVKRGVITITSKWKITYLNKYKSTKYFGTTLKIYNTCLYESILNWMQLTDVFMHRKLFIIKDVAKENERTSIYKLHSPTIDTCVRWAITRSNDEKLRLFERKVL